MFTSISKQNRLAATAAAALLVAGFASPALAAHHGEEKMAEANIVETAQSAGQFGTLIAAAAAAGLADTLANGGPFTVFAPTDAAFAKLPEGTVETLLKPENKDQLARILKFHVLSGKVGSAALADGISVDTLADAAAGIAAAGDGFTIEGANIVATDIAASNGVIHVIDAVILPPEPTAAMSGSDPALDIIDTAVDAGVPLFNHGNAEATKAAYTVAATSLLRFAGEAGLSNAARMRLASSLDRAQGQGARAGAWTLRDALDDVRAERLHDTLQMARN